MSFEVYKVEGDRDGNENYRRQEEGRRQMSTLMVVRWQMRSWLSK